VVVSDIEGNFNALHSLLIANGVMNQQFEWIYQDGHLVVLGDLVDKGSNVTQCLWLIYHLESRARAHGGHVHFILGNHEMMNLTLDVRYVPEKCLALAQKVTKIENPSLAYWHLLKRNNVLLNWIKGKNCMEKIGDLLFVHAGISPEMITRKLSIEKINETVREFISSEAAPTRLAEFLLGKSGPLWYRGLVASNNGYEKASESQVDTILDFYGVKKIIVGHTLVDNISSDYHGRVLRADVKHSESKLSEESQALLIEGGVFYRVSGNGSKEIID
jgi:hydrogenase maturation factor